ncbi:MAG: hypothetical protein GF330_04720, partial [Candidatus Eisenbacteria bacterium]|nr:hypothetical protein [Candidatus Eisenbacteria bacterium]
MGTSRRIRASSIRRPATSGCSPTRPARASADAVRWAPSRSSSRMGTARDNRLAAREISEVRALIEEACHHLQEVGFRARGAEAQALLTSHGALRSAAGRLQVSPPRTRELLEQLPSGLTLFDREGDKLATLAGGRDISGSGPIWASAATPTRRARRGEEESATLSAEDLWPLADASARLAHCLALGAAPLPDPLAPPLALLLRLYVGFCTSTHPQIARVRRGAEVERIWDLLRTLQGDAQAVERRPVVLLELSLERRGELGAAACRILIDSARHGLPLVIRLPALTGDNGQTEPSPLVEIVATGLSAILVHQTARARAPLLWGLPPIGPDAPRPRLQRGAMLLGVADEIALPAVATSRGSDDAAHLLSAAWAAARGARMILLDAGAEDVFDMQQLSRLAARVPEVAALARHAPGAGGS